MDAVSKEVKGARITVKGAPTFKESFIFSLFAIVVKVMGFIRSEEYFSHANSSEVIEITSVSLICSFSSTISIN